MPTLSTLEHSMKEREVVMAEFVKIPSVGHAVAGRVVQYGENSNGPFVVLHPVFVRSGLKAQWQRYADAAVGLTTDLRRKVSSDDKGKILMLEYVDTKPSKSGSPQKLFKVYDLDQAEAKKLADLAGPTLPGKINPDVEHAPATDDVFAEYTGGSEPIEDDNLPF